MIPILYESTETSFNTNGLGRLSDAVECTVTEERNGGFELYLRYPVKGVHYSDIALDRLLYAPHDDTKTPQAFRIYKITKPINGIVSVYAEHISYQLSRIIVAPFTATSCAGAISGLETYAIGDMGFTFWTDKSVVADFSVEVPQPIRGLLAGQSGSILDVFGSGEYEWDMNTVKLHTRRGSDGGVTLRYGKNITDITADMDMTGTYTAIVPFWTNGEKTVMLPEKILYADTQYANTLAKAVDFSSDFEEEPTVSSLRTRAKTYLANNKGWIIKQNVKVDFVQLWQTKEYETYAPLQRVRLCDTVTVIYEPLEISTTAEVVKTVYNVLLERYDEIEIGEASTAIVDIINDAADEVKKNIPTKNFLLQSIERATEMITGGKGGYVRFTYNADGEPEEILIMDQPDIETAVNVWRWNKNGLGFSSSGYDGTYRTAITADGHIVADFIDTGYLSASRIRAGLLKALSGWVEFDIDAGILKLGQIQLWTATYPAGFIATHKITSSGEEFYDGSGKKATEINMSGIFYHSENGNGFTIANGNTDPSAPNGHIVVSANDDGLVSIGNNVLIDVDRNGSFYVRYNLGDGPAMELNSSGITIYNNTPIKCYSDIDMNGFSIRNANIV